MAGEAVKDLEAAWEEVEEKETPTEEPEETEVEEEEAESEEPEATDETEESEEPEPEEEEEEEAPEETEETEEAEEPEEQVEAAPNSWSAEARESWKDIPKAARDYIQQRERQMAIGMQKNAEHAQRAQQMDRVLAPHSQYFAMTGNQPAKTISNLLTVASGLAMGSQLQQAQTVSQLIKQFGVDIETLDTVLSGEAPTPEMQQGQQFTQQLQQELAPIREFMQGQQQFQQSEQQRSQESYMAEIEAFASDSAHEFYNDVELLMADILELAGNRGEDLTLQEAYKRACEMDPNVSKIIRQRQEAEALSKKKKAAKSIPAKGAKPSGPKEPESLHDALSAAWDAHTQ